MYILFKAFRKIWYMLYHYRSLIYTFIIIKGNRVVHGNGFKSYGVPKIDVWKGGGFVIGDNFRMNNGHYYNLIGRQQPCIFVVRTEALLEIGNNVGMSSTAIVCSRQIKIGNNVKIGGNTVIYDTDFHSISYEDRCSSVLDVQNTLSESVEIGDNVFIGAHSTILKGVVIGKNSIIGACSVVTKNIPSNQIWAGNPVKFIRNI